MHCEKALFCRFANHKCPPSENKFVHWKYYVNKKNLKKICHATWWENSWLHKNFIWLCFRLPLCFKKYLSLPCLFMLFLLDIKKPDRFVLHRSRFYFNCISLSVYGDKLHNKCQLIFAKVLLFKHIHLKDPSTWW